ncbi:MAG: hypothetical protein HYW08_09805 [candidate division NC10 bacterium]|nr:hypothetical protein [candidate division NC10 bacterium]
METRCLRILAIGLLVVGLLAGCATTAARQDLGGLVRAENPEYLGHPLRMISLGFNFVGNIAQYGVVEPFYFMLAPCRRWWGSAWRSGATSSSARRPGDSTSRASARPSSS